MANPDYDSLKRRLRSQGIPLLGILCTLWTSGCVHRDRKNGLARGAAEVSLPALTSVTTWPLGVLLTNGSAFESEFSLALEDPSGRPLILSGQLLVSGGKLRLEAARSNGKAMRTGDFGVIWDTSGHQGFVFSEALQGYSPISVAAHCTNLLVQTIGGETERIEGHSVDKSNVTMMRNDGQTMIVQLLRSQDGNLPLRISSSPNSPFSFVLTLSNIQLLKPADELLLPPDGFTKYESETAMLDELADRQQSVSGVRHQQSSEGGESDQSGGGRRSRGGP
ncbi:MAG: hypothetical protein ABSH48_19555 [Verrucomicrobiota bacterium]